jgi:deazaflavin-dependent oxidoreductase (nitroreductase family)
MAEQTRLRFMRPFTIRVVNPLTRLVAGWLPGFAIITHVGRISGRSHRTPMNVFRDGDQYVFALTYGSDVQWVRNVIAAGTCELRSMGRVLRLVEPEMLVDPDRRLVPRPVRFFLRLLRVSEFLRMRRA